MYEIANTIRNRVKLDNPETINIFKDLTTFLNTKKIVNKTLSSADKKWGIGLKDIIIGGGLGATTGLGGAVAGVAAKKAIESPLSKTTMAVGIDRLNSAISKLPIDEFGKISMSAINNLINSMQK